MEREAVVKKIRDISLRISCVGGKEGLFPSTAYNCIIYSYSYK